MKAIWNNEIIAMSDDTIVVENNHYFPHDSIHQTVFRVEQHAHRLRLERSGKLLRCHRQRRNQLRRGLVLSGGEGRS